MSFIAIASQTLNSSAANVTFSSIPSSISGLALRDLVIIANFTSNSAAQLAMRVNTNDPFGRGVFLLGNGSNAVTNNITGGSLPLTGDVFSNVNDRCQVRIDLLDYTQTNRHKSLITRLDIATGSFPGTSLAGAVFETTAAITSVRLEFGGGQTFQSGSTFNLFGVSA